MYGEVSKDGGTTWTTIFTWTGVVSEDLYGVGISCGPGSIVQPKTLGFA